MVTAKIDVIESNFERSERENQIKFADIKSGIAKVEKSVTANVIESIEPRISVLKSEMSTEMRDEMRKLLKDEMENTYKIGRRDEDVVEESSEEEVEDPKGEPAKKKNKKSKENQKNRKPKKNDEEAIVPSPDEVNLGASTSQE